MSVKPLVPDSKSIGQVLTQSDPLLNLQQRVKASGQRLDAVSDCLPLPLIPHIKSGPLDDQHWTLLVSNQAVAAKLHHLKPRIEAALESHGWPARTLRIKVLPTQTP